MIVAITFTDASEEKIIHNVENVYTKGKMLVVRQQDWLWKYPLMNVSMVRRSIDGDHEYIATKEANIEIRVIPLHSAAEKIFTNAQDVGTKRRYDLYPTGRLDVRIPSLQCIFCLS